jgi:hypothetical protein
MRGRIAVMAVATLLTWAVAGFGASMALASAQKCESRIENTTIVGKLVVGPGCELDSVTVEGEMVVGRGGSLANTTGVVVTGSLGARGATGIHIMGLSVGGNLKVTESRDVNLEEAHVAGALVMVRDTGEGVVMTGTVTGNVIFKEEATEVLIADGLEIGGRLKFNGDQLNAAGAASIYAEHDTVKGSILVEGNTLTAPSTFLVLAGDKVGQPVKINLNTLNGTPTFEVRENTITGSLTCVNNAPGPTLVSENSVSGKTVGQCA